MGKRSLRPKCLIAAQMKRRRSRPVRIGAVTVGGSAPISVQSMTNTDTRDLGATLRQARQLERVGCEILRVAVPDREAASCLGKLKRRISIPLVADIHFDYRLALMALEEGVDALRLNPGNIYRPAEVEEVVKAAKRKRIPIRVGLNSGSLPRKRMAGCRRRPRSPRAARGQRHTNQAQAMVRGAVSYIRRMEHLGFRDIIVSLKASDVPTTIEAYRRLASTSLPYPFHLGVTASGPLREGSIRSAVGIGTLLSEGLGDTVRVSLTGDPQEEVRVAYELLNSLGLRRRGPQVISCPTCGRCRVDLIRIVERAQKKLAARSDLDGLRVAIMGCEVNGPGEARGADIGIACGWGAGLLFRSGKVIRKLKEKDLLPGLLKEIDSFSHPHRR